MVDESDQEILESFDASIFTFIFNLFYCVAVDFIHHHILLLFSSLFSC